MRRTAILVLALAALLPGAAAHAAPTLPLGHAGRWFTDADGRRVVVLHGFNMVSKRPPYAPDAVGFGDDDAAFLAAEGYDSIRLGVIYKAVEPEPGVYDDAYLERIAATVRTLHAHGITTLLDFHQDLYNERFQGEGWPDWAVQDDGLPAQPKAGFPGNYLQMRALQRAFDHFFDDAPGPGGVGLQERYAAAWRHVAERFRSEPGVMGYDLLNEPWPGSAWQQCVNPQGCAALDDRLRDFSKRMIAAIRQADERTLVFYEPYVLFNNGPKTTLGALGDPRLAFSFHDYCLGNTGEAGNSGCDTLDDMVFANAEAQAAAGGDALLLTEYGATDRADVLRAMTDRADRTMVGWQEWHYCPCEDPTTTGSGAVQAIVLDPKQPPAGANLKSAKLDLLSRPYPQVVAGTPTAYGFDRATRTFTLAYRTARAGDPAAAPFGADAATEVAVPARQYPDGYAAQVQGGRVTSAPGARPLTVAACAGAVNVRVTVTPTGSRTQSCAAPAATRPPPAASSRLRVSVAPKRLVAGVRTRLRVRVSLVQPGRRSQRVRGARVRVAGRTLRTDGRGRIVLRVRLSAVGRRTLVIRAPSVSAKRTTLTVVRRRG